MIRPGSTIALPARKARRAHLDFALPTINVVLLLILFFLVAGTIVQEEEIGIAPPVVSEVPDARLPRPLLAHTADGQLLLDGVEVGADDLVAAAQAAVTEGGGALNVLMPLDSAARPLLRYISQIGNADIPVRLVTARPVEVVSPAPAEALGP